MVSSGGFELAICVPRAGDYGDIPFLSVVPNSL